MRAATARLAVALLLGITALSAAPSTSHAARSCAGADAVPARDGIREARRAVQCLLNRERAARGMRRLRQERRLTRAATRHSRAMRARRFFDHTSPRGTTMLARVRAAGYLRGRPRYTVGENIGWGSGILATPREMVEAWMDSPGHRANILNRRFRDVGIGVVIGTPRGGAGVTYTTNFGSRR